MHIIANWVGELDVNLFHHAPLQKDTEMLANQLCF